MHLPLNLQRLCEVKACGRLQQLFGCIISNLRVGAGL
jgi:hypothetical protein